MRINKIVNLIKPNSIIIDVGSDHAKVAIKSLTNKVATFVYNIEINQAPLDNTIKNLNKFNLLDKTNNILNDGLKNLKINDKINYCIIAGMGGKNIINILSNKPKQLLIDSYILVPNNNAYLLRSYLKDNGYKIQYEEIIKESNHYYELIQTSKHNGLKISSNEDCFFGSYNLKHQNKSFTEYHKNNFNHILNSKNHLVNKQKAEELELLKKVCKK